MPKTPPAPPAPARGDGRTPRRDFLRLAALAPLAAGCASLPAAPGRTAGPVEGAPAAAPAEGRDALAAVRAFPLPPDAEPASLFRAEVARGRGP